MRSSLNKTLTLSRNEFSSLKEKFIRLRRPVSIDEIENKTIHQDYFDVIDYLPNQFVDLLFVDPLYNLNKEFNSIKFNKMGDEAYENWVDSWLSKLVRLLKPTASIYVCGDWQSSSAIYRTMKRYFIVRNRITWEREKGRGALSNWKNCSEDIWYGTVSKNFFFDSERVKLKKAVVAPYKDEEGRPKDWLETQDGNFRLTYPSNLWTDITIPFWSMTENTDHPTQKPEKLVAKILLTSSREGDFVFDPFLGSGTTSVVAKKLGRKYCGVEIDEKYAALAEKRLEIAEFNRTIQGYKDGVFWERNSLTNGKSRNRKEDKILSLKLI